MKAAIETLESQTVWWWEKNPAGRRANSKVSSKILFQKGASRFFATVLRPKGAA